MSDMLNTPVDNGRKCVLVIDDEADIVEVMTVSLQLKGHEVLSASDGEKALEILRRHAVDVVVSDVRMPRINGIELFKTVRDTMTPPPPFIFTTGFSKLIAEISGQVGVAAVLLKPFRLAELEQAIRAAPKA